MGSLIVIKLALASLSRQDIPEANRRPLYLYADEVQNFIHGVDFATILSETRKYALSLTIGTQTLAQLSDETLAAVFGNCATLVSFRVSGNDAHALVREFAASGEGPRLVDQAFDIIPASELQNLPDYKLYVRTLLNGRPLLYASRPLGTSTIKIGRTTRVRPVEGRILPRASAPGM